MRLVSVVNYAGDAAWVNADAVAYVLAHGRDECLVHFIGAKDHTLHCKETLGEVAKKIRGPLNLQS